MIINILLLFSCVHDAKKLLFLLRGLAVCIGDMMFMYRTPTSFPWRTPASTCWTCRSTEPWRRPGKYRFHGRYTSLGGGGVLKSFGHSDCRVFISGHTRYHSSRFLNYVSPPSMRQPYSDLIVMFTVFAPKALYSFDFNFLFIFLFLRFS
jgi:hypothetical protein